MFSVLKLKSAMKIQSLLLRNFVKYIWILISITFYALILALFHNSDLITATRLKLVVDLSTIIGYTATTIGVCVAGYEFKNWKQVKKYDQKVESFNNLFDAIHSLYAAHGRLVPYLRLLKSNKGINNPQFTYEKLKNDLVEINKYNDIVSKQIETRILFFDKTPRNMYSDIFPGVNLDNIFADKILNKIFLPEGTQISLAGWLLKINTEETINEIESWLSIAEKTLVSIKALNDYVREAKGEILK